MVAADVPQIAELERVLFGPSAWSEAMLAGELHAPGRWYLVAVEGPVPGAPEGAVADDPAAEAVGPGGTVVGYAGLWFDGDVSQVMTIGVAPAVQRQGIGATLLTALVDRSRELGASALLLEVRVDNEPAIALYERFGFEILSRRRRYYQPEDVDAWTMRLELAAQAPGEVPDPASDEVSDGVDGEGGAQVDG